LDLAINLGNSDLIPMEDKISFGGLPPAMSPEDAQKKVMESIPSIISPQELDDEPNELELPTSKESSLPKNPVKAPQDNLERPALVPQDAPVKPVDPVPASQTVEQSPTLSEELPASSSPPEPTLPEVQSPESVPSLPQ
jgi:hypothetical protein